MYDRDSHILDFMVPKVHVKQLVLLHNIQFLETKFTLVIGIITIKVFFSAAYQLKA